MHVSVQINLLLICASNVISSPRIRTRITHGHAEGIRSVPYQASIGTVSYSGWSYLCGAAIISDRAILTAAHCFNEPDALPVQLKVGTSDLLIGGVMYDIRIVIIHEYYSRMTNNNDIALLITRETIIGSPSIQKIFIPRQNYYLREGTTARVSGFGAVKNRGTVQSRNLQVTNVYIVAQETCARAYNLKGMQITPGMLCASDSPRDACDGDSGSPLVVNQYLVGIVSWGDECGSSVYPGVYTRVSAYSSWILEKISQYSNGVY